MVAFQNNKNVGSRWIVEEIIISDADLAKMDMDSIVRSVLESRYKAKLEWFQHKIDQMIVEKKYLHEEYKRAVDMLMYTDAYGHQEFALEYYKNRIIDLPERINKYKKRELQYRLWRQNYKLKWREKSCKKSKA